MLHSSDLSGFKPAPQRRMCKEWLAIEPECPDMIRLLKCACVKTRGHSVLNEHFTWLLFAQVQYWAKLEMYDGNTLFRAKTSELVTSLASVFYKDWSFLARLQWRREFNEQTIATVISWSNKSMHWFLKICTLKISKDKLFQFFTFSTLIYW